MPTAEPTACTLDEREVAGDIDFTPQTEIARLDQLSPHTRRRHERATARRPAR
jgi:hypothetical protein